MDTSNQKVNSEETAKVEIAEEVNTLEIEAPSEATMRVIGVRFRTAGKVYYFDPGQLKLKCGTYAIVETTRGPE
jgi:hypothetical protein